MSSAMSYPPEQRYLVTKQCVLQGMARGLRFTEDRKYRCCFSKTRPVNPLFSGTNAVWGNYVLGFFFQVELVICRGWCNLNQLFSGRDAFRNNYVLKVYILQLILGLVQSELVTSTGYFDLDQICLGALFAMGSI